MGCSQSTPNGPAKRMRGSLAGDIGQAGAWNGQNASSSSSTDQNCHGGKKAGLLLEQMPEATMEGRFGSAKVRYAYMSKRGHYPDGK